MGIISVEQADHLLWLGRYTERVYTTLCMYSQNFDRMIDEIAESYPEYCKKMDIPNIYQSKEDFQENYPFSADNPDSIISNLNRAYDNAIVLRESIGSDTLSYIQLAIYDMAKAKASRAPLIEMQHIIDSLLAFWGIADDSIESEQVRNLIKAGKRIERIDLYARMGMEREKLKREVNRMIPRVERSGLEYDKNRLNSLKELVQSTNIDYYKIVHEVESIF